ncbi:MAG TPA: proton-conducting transporter membrane subunit [Anaerolineales bacterium]|nr:proton-conducting transporter membrane subunit [Anaerolineales bacterium]
METFSFIWIILLPLTASPLIYLSGRVGKSRSHSIPQILALIALLSAWIPFTQAAMQLNRGEQLTFTIGVISLCLDGLGLLVAAVSLGLGTFVVLFSGPYLSVESGREKYYAMLTGMIAMMIGLGCACDLFNLWVWFEAMAITSYLLVTFYREQPASLEAGIKYLVQSAAGSVLVLLGIGIIYAQTGSLNITEIRAVQDSSTALLAAGALFVIGYGVKSALVPLHTWLPDAHSQAPSGISAMLSGIVIEVGLVAMLRSLSTLSYVTTLWGPLLIGFGVLNMVVGNMMALHQKHVKRLLAYSSLTHVGYMLVGLGIAIYLGNANGAVGGLFHLFNHGLMKGLAFLAAGALLYALHIAVGDHAPLMISDLSGASQRYPILALTFSLALLSLGGIPFLAGFMSKWQIILGGFQTGDIVIALLVIFAALNSVFSLVYYVPLVNSVYRRQPSNAVQLGGSIPGIMTVPLLVMTIGVIIIGVWPSIMNWLIYPAGYAVLAGFGW